MGWFLPILFGSAATGTAGWGAITFPEETKELIANIGDFVIDPEVVKAIEDATGEKLNLWEAFMATRKIDGLQLKAIAGDEEAIKQLPESLRPKTVQERVVDKIIKEGDERTGGAVSKIAGAMSGDGKEGKGIMNWVLEGLMNTDGGFDFGKPAMVAIAGGGLAAASSMFFGTDLINPKLALLVIGTAFAVVNWDELVDLKNDITSGVAGPTSKIDAIVIPNTLGSVNLNTGINTGIDLTNVHASAATIQLNNSAQFADDYLYDNGIGVPDDYHLDMEGMHIA